jgi:hypothetical protein
MVESILHAISCRANGTGGVWRGMGVTGASANPPYFADTEKEQKTMRKIAPNFSEYMNFMGPQQIFRTSTGLGTCALIEAIGRQKINCELFVNCLQKKT